MPNHPDRRCDRPSRAGEGESPNARATGNGAALTSNKHRRWRAVSGAGAAATAVVAVLAAAIGAHAVIRAAEIQATAAAAQTVESAREAILEACDDDDRSVSKSICQLDARVLAMGAQIPATSARVAGAGAGEHTRPVLAVISQRHRDALRQRRELTWSAVPAREICPRTPPRMGRSNVAQLAAVRATLALASETKLPLRHS